MDDIDRAQDHIEKTLALQIAQARVPFSRRHIGECLNCGERLTDGRRYCDDDCRADSERRENNHQRSGGV